MIFRCGVLLVGTCLTISAAQQQCACPRDRKLVCGSDGKTYDNLCLLKCEQRTRPSLTLLGLGPCKEVTPGCFCAYENSPLCASDGVNYPSECEFKCQQNVNPQLRIRNKGKCRKGRQVSPLLRPVRSSSRPRLDKVTPSLSCVCPTDLSTVCGTDRVTYDNECLLKCVSRNKSGLRVKHEGPCTTINEVTEGNEIEGYENEEEGSDEA